MNPVCTQKSVWCLSIVKPASSDHCITWHDFDIILTVQYNMSRNVLQNISNQYQDNIYFAYQISTYLEWFNLYMTWSCSWSHDLVTWLGPTHDLVRHMTWSHDLTYLTCKNTNFVPKKTHLICWSQKMCLQNGHFYLFYSRSDICLKIGINM